MDNQTEITIDDVMQTTVPLSSTEMANKFSDVVAIKGDSETVPYSCPDLQKFLLHKSI